MAAEEIFQLENAARRVHELLRRDARDGGLVQVERFGDFAQHERSHGDLAVLEEMALPVDDSLRDAQDRIEALLHVLDEPLRFLELARELLRARSCARATGYRRKGG